MWDSSNLFDSERCDFVFFGSSSNQKSSMKEYSYSELKLESTSQMKVCNTETKLASQGTVRIFQVSENIKNLELPNKKTTNVAKHQSLSFFLSEKMGRQICDGEVCGEAVNPKRPCLSMERP